MEQKSYQVNQQTKILDVSELQKAHYISQLIPNNSTGSIADEQNGESSGARQQSFDTQNKPQQKLNQNTQEFKMDLEPKKEELQIQNNLNTDQTNFNNNYPNSVKADMKNKPSEASKMRKDSYQTTEGFSNKNYIYNNNNNNNNFNNNYNQNNEFNPCPVNNSNIIQPSNIEQKQIEEKPQKLNFTLESFNNQKDLIIQENIDKSLQEQKIEVLLRSKKGTFLQNFRNNKLQNEEAVSKDKQFSFFIQKGVYLVTSDSDNIIKVYSTQHQKEITQIQRNTILFLSASPGNQFLITIEKLDKDNYSCFILDSLQLYPYFQVQISNFSRERQPYVLFDYNEEYLITQMEKEIKIYDTSSFELISTIQNKEFKHFYISPSLQQPEILLINPQYMAGYDIIKGRVEIYRLKQMIVGKNSPIHEFILEDSEYISPHWSFNGSSLLIWTQTNNDSSGKSYYGVHNLYRYEKQSLTKIQMYKGQIHDVQWSPDGETFIVLSGFVPVGSILFSKEGIPLYEFGRHHRNTAKWSPLKRYLLLGGFGNMSGDIEIWDTLEFTKVGVCKAECGVSVSWSPCGTKFMVGVLYPRLREGNQIKIFQFDGTLINKVDFSDSELYEVLWKPTLNVFLDQQLQSNYLKQQEQTKSRTVQSEFMKGIQKQRLFGRQLQLDQQFIDENEQNEFDVNQKEDLKKDEWEINNKLEDLDNQTRVTTEISSYTIQRAVVKRDINDETVGAGAAPLPPHSQLNISSNSNENMNEKGKDRKFMKTNDEMYVQKPPSRKYSENAFIPQTESLRQNSGSIYIQKSEIQQRPYVQQKEIQENRRKNSKNL